MSTFDVKKLSKKTICLKSLVRCFPHSRTKAVFSASISLLPRVHVEAGEIAICTVPQNPNLDPQLSSCLE